MFTFIHSVLASVAIVGANASLAAQPIEIKSYKPTAEAIFPVVSNLLIFILVWRRLFSLILRRKFLLQLLP